ncbi:D-aminoacyl-tRNA deacylase isoform X2 [Gastrolobium bilobum]|uniref:D-aminoacyl-tRNA deacylase isoform X2 n=1 Tax=Gastrolobium bilobum TaxID=150636 RepID=UPI002AB1573D|nr:D-aminoacyl-tRNA deacylase isoform X2 [Gastrolobium bilobum]
MLLRTIRYCRARPQPILPAAKHFHHLLLPFPLPVFHLNRGLRSSKPVSIVSHINTSYSSSSSPSINQSPLSLSPSSSTSTHQRNKPNQSLQERETFSNKAMVALLVATTTDPASINPANALLAMPGWQPRPHFQDDMKSFVNEGLRVLLHGKSIVVEDDLDKRWEEVTGEVIDEVIFFSKHTAVSNKPALTVHPIGVPHLREGDVPPQGGKPGWAALPNPRIGPWLRLLKNMAQAHNLVPEFEITLEATHHGPLTNKPTMFLEIGSTEDYWKRQDAAQVMAQLVWEGLGLGGGTDVGNWSRENANKKVLLGIGGGHYVPRHMDVVLKDDVWVGHLLSGYSLPMEDPNQSKRETNVEIGGTWRDSIKAAYEATRSAFPGGEILAHLDHNFVAGVSRAGRRMP